KAKIGTGEAAGQDRARRAAVQALTDPLLDEEVAGAHGLLVSISGGDDLLLWEVDEAVREITDLVDADADIIWGSSHDPSLDGRIRVSIVAAGLGMAATAGAQPPRFVQPERIEIAPMPEPEAEAAELVPVPVMAAAAPIV